MVRENIAHVVKKRPMPWIPARLRGQRVLARARPDGKLDTEGGRVEIRYKPNDGRAYRAAASNLVVEPGASLLPDDTCTSAETTPRRSPKAAPVSAPVPQSSAQWVAYTDGACSGNPGPAGAGIVLIGPGPRRYEGYEYLGPASTNNVAELTAVLRALEAIPVDARSIVVFTDSKYAIGVLSKGWKAKRNTELVARTKAALEARNRKAGLEYVPGHSGVPLNERADELARLAIQTARSQPVQCDQ